MTGLFSVRRRADEFDAALSDPSAPLTEREARQFAELLALVADLRSIPELTPRPDFVADLRSRLMTEADTALLPQSARPLTAEEQRISLPVRATGRDRRLAAMLGGAALVGATTSMAVAAQTALPGESLYPVKRALEEAQTGIARGDAAEGGAMLASARGRLDEIDALADRSSPASVSAISSTLETFSEQSGDASESLFAAYGANGDEALIVDLRTFTTSSIDRLSDLQSALPVSSREELVAAAEQLNDIDRRASEVCPSCGGAPMSLPSNLVSTLDTSHDVGSVIVAASQDPVLNTPANRPRDTVGASEGPAPISGQDVDDVVVPDLSVPDPSSTPTPTAPAPGPTAAGANGGGGNGGGVSGGGVSGGGGSGGSGGSGGVKAPGTTTVEQPVNEVTKLLTGDLDDAASGLPVTNEVTSGVGTAVDGTLAELEGTLAETTDSLLP